MKNMILAVIFTAAPAAAQTTVRAPVSGLSAIPGLGAPFDGARLGATPMPTLMMPALTPGMQAPAVTALALMPTLTPTLVQPALAVSILAAAAKPVEGSPLGVIRDASADEAQKTAALDRLFENSAPSSPEALVVSARPAAAAGDIGSFPAMEYTNLKSAIKSRGVKANLAMQASRTRREGCYWFTVNILGTGDDFKKIEDLFERDSGGWSYAGIPTDIQLRGITVDPAAPLKAASETPADENARWRTKMRVRATGHGLSVEVRLASGLVLKDARRMFNGQDVELSQVDGRVIAVFPAEYPAMALKIAQRMAELDNVETVTVAESVAWAYGGRREFGPPMGEFSGAPAWFDVSKLKFDALVKSGTGGTAVLRYGWRSQFEMSVFAFPGDASVSFKEYSTNPMDRPKQSFDASLQKAASRAAAAKILRAVQAKNPVAGKDKATLDAMLTLLSTLVHDRPQGLADQASAKAPARGQNQDNVIAFDFTSLDPTSRYFLGAHPTKIENIGGRGIIMSVSRDNRSQGSYLVRYVNGEGVKVLGAVPTHSALRGLQEMLMIQLQSGALRDPLYARMLEEIRATLAPAYVPGTPDPLWRYLWTFKYRSMNPTVAYYGGYRTATVATPHDGAIEMVLSRASSDKLILTWSARSGFKGKREDGFVFSPNASELRGMQLSLMKEMLETGSRGPLTSTLLQKFQSAVGD
jgi:hypothetical protein